MAATSYPNIVNEMTTKAEIKTHYKHIAFYQVEGIENVWYCRKTRRPILQTQNKKDLGVVKWDRLWKYWVFDQETDVIFSVSGLSELIEFMKQLDDVGY